LLQPLPVEFKKFKINKPSVEVKILNLIKYSTICCQNGKGTMAIAIDKI
jgi:hypothetical protein